MFHLESGHFGEKKFCQGDIQHVAVFNVDIKFSSGDTQNTFAEILFFLFEISWNIWLTIFREQQSISLQKGKT